VWTVLGTRGPWWSCSRCAADVDGLGLGRRAEQLGTVQSSAVAWAACMCIYVCSRVVTENSWLHIIVIVFGFCFQAHERRSADGEA
jgi:hypothetical protein